MVQKYQLEIISDKEVLIIKKPNILLELNLKSDFIRKYWKPLFITIHARLFLITLNLAIKNRVNREVDVVGQKETSEAADSIVEEIILAILIPGTPLITSSSTQVTI